MNNTQELLQLMKQHAENPEEIDEFGDDHEFRQFRYEMYVNISETLSPFEFAILANLRLSGKTAKFYELIGNFRRTDILAAQAWQNVEEEIIKIKRTPNFESEV